MNKLESHRAEATAARLERYDLDPRREKRLFRRNGVDAVYAAYNWGQGNAWRRHPIGNPFPPGRRHDAFDLGQKQSRG